MARQAVDPGAVREIPLRVLGIAGGAHPPGRHSTSRELLELALRKASRSGATVRSFDLTALRYHACPEQERICGWPCRLTVADPGDGLAPVYDALVEWADVVLISTAIEGGELAEPMRRFLQRLGCIRHELEVNQRLLVRDKVAAFLLAGARSTAPSGLVQGFAELGFAIPPFPVSGPPQDSCLAAEAESFERVLQVHPEAADGAEALVMRAMELACRIGAGPRFAIVGGRERCFQAAGG